VTVLNKDKGLIVLALLLAITAASVVYWYISGLKSELQDPGQTEIIVVAREEIPRHRVINKEMLQEKTVPLGTKIPGSYDKAEDVVGKVTVAPVFAGQQPVENQLAEIGKGNKGLSYMLQNGKRAITLSVNEVSAVAGYILPGDMVDVIATMNISDSNGEKITFNTFVIQNVRLLAIGAEGADSTRSQAAQAFSTATVEVDTEQIPKLALASDEGRIRLVLRPALDNSYSGNPAFEMEQFLHDDGR